MTQKFCISRLVRPNVAAISAYSSARDEFTGTKQGLVFLDANENPFSGELSRYPDPRQRELKQFLSEQREVPETRILLGNGSDEVLDLLFRAFCRPGLDNVITLPPTYGMYKVLADLNDIENRQVLLTDDFQPDVPQILARSDQNTKLLLLCSPNNPTGNLFNPELVESLLGQFDGLVVIDEAYIDFSSDPGWVRRLAEFPNLVVTQTLSKAYAMAALRLGICYGSTEIIAILNRIKPPYNINQLSQDTALTNLRTRDPRQEITIILEEREKMSRDLEQLSYVKEVFPSDANFLLVRMDDASLRYDQLLKAGFVVRNRSSQPLCGSTLRITIGTPTENELLIQTLKQL